MTIKHLDVMVDLETTGTEPGNSAIIQLAAVRFDFATGDIMTETFDRCLMIPPRRFFDEDTRNWWLKDKRDILTSIMGRMEQPRKVLEDFITWARAGVDPYNDTLRLWAKPSHFDFAFLESYFRQFELPNPFHYREVNDMNSWIRGRYWPQTPPAFERELPFVGPKHSAIFDIFHQLKVIYAVRDHSVRHPSLSAPGEVVDVAS